MKCQSKPKRVGTLVRHMKGRKIDIGFFAKSEDGSLLILSLMLFLLMAMMGGLAVDLMRFEQRRTDMQQTLDRSVLAAASISQELDPEDVVNDYFAKAGLSDNLDWVNVSSGLNFRAVTAAASSTLSPFFMNMIGIDDIEVGTGSGAEQRITNVEVSMVLDISGSMQNTPSRIINLKAAAKEFVDTVLSSDEEDRISISLVPYNGQVNLGPNLFSKYTQSYTHNFPNSYCMDLPTSTFNTESVPRNSARPQAGFFDSYSSASTSSSYQSPQSPYYVSPNYVNVWCQPNLNNIVRPLQNNIGLLQGYIEGLSAVGATSIDLGMKWGLNLLSPDTASVVSGLVSDGIVPSQFNGRPFDYTRPDSMKVIVLMTDGEHFAAEELNDAYRTGNSPIYRSKGDGRVSIYHNRSGTNYDYYRPDNNSWNLAPYSNTSAGYERLTWPDVWASYRMKWVAWQLYARPLGSSQYNTMMNAFRSQTPTNEMDNRLQDVCNLAKNKGVIVYGIAFEAPYDGQTQIRNCATSTSHYFDVSGVDISTAFRSIANNISQLKLTQ
ncbi:hypothetical protein EGN72_06890 [Pseudorhodobacter sp. E13]|nr:hypothetical protein EGN72_06890 [Pseudorhodobacter sp. E13]